MFFLFLPCFPGWWSRPNPSTHDPARHRGLARIGAGALHSLYDHNSIYADQATGEGIPRRYRQVLCTAFMIILQSMQTRLLAKSIRERLASLGLATR